VGLDQPGVPALLSPELIKEFLELRSVLFCQKHLPWQLSVHAISFSFFFGGSGV
jgi:hypothetical protein